MRVLRAHLPGSPSSTLHLLRTYINPTRAAQEAGLVIHKEDHLIAEKLSVGDTVPGAQSAAEQFLTEGKSELVAYLGETLPALEPPTAWVAVVGAAVLIRTTHCLVSRVTLYRQLERSLPFAAWFYQRNVEFSTWQLRNNVEKMKGVMAVVDEFKKEHSLRGAPNTLRKKSVFAGIKLAVVNGVLLHLLSEIYQVPLSEAPFLWIPSLAASDPLYVLPFLNLALCVGMYRIVGHGLLFPKGKFSGTPSVMNSIKTRPLTSLPFVLLAGYCGGYVTIAASANVPSLFMLFWTASNVTGILLTLALTRINQIRRPLGLVPHEQFMNMISRDVAINPDRVQNDRKKLNKQYEDKLFKEQEALRGGENLY